jgi:drug/metabolite transporter (DMT)-like permease
MNKPHLQAIACLIMTCLLWSTGGVLIKLVHWNPVALSGGRSLIAALVILLYIKKPRARFSLPLAGGTLAYATTVLLFVASTKLTTAASAILLQYTAPIYVAIFGAWLLKEKTTPVDWAAIFTVLGGMALFFLDDLSGGSFWGNILGIGSGVSFAFLIMLMRKQRDDSPLDLVFWGNLATAAVGLPFMLGPLPDGSSILGLLLLGVFQMGLAYILYAKALRHIQALEAVLIQVIEPLLNPLWVLLIIGEKPSFWSLVGGAIVLLAVAGRGVIVALRQGEAASGRRGLSSEE